MEPDPAAVPSASHPRCAHAGEVARVVLDQGDSAERRDFIAAARSLPARIRRAGLGHALLTLRVEGAATLLSALDAWIRLARPDPRKGDLVNRIICEDQAFLRFATAEALAWLRCLDRAFAAGPAR